MMAPFRDSRVEQIQADLTEAATRYSQAQACLDDARTLAADILEIPPGNWEAVSLLESLRDHINHALILHRQLVTHLAFAADDVTNLLRCHHVTEGGEQCLLKPGHKGRCRDANGFTWSAS